MLVCGDCKFWNKEHSEEQRGGGMCSCEKFVGSYGASFDDGSVPDDGVLVESDEGWCFLTGKNFRCIHFQLRGAIVR